MRVKTVYVAGDGREFESEEACSQWESVLSVRDDVEKFVGSFGYSKGAQQTGLINRLMEWEAYKATGVLPDRKQQIKDDAAQEAT